MSRIVLFIVVLAVAVPARFAQAGPCMPFFDQAAFEDFNVSEGKSLDGIETFEESNIPPQGKIQLPAPLDQNPNTFAGFGFHNGLKQQHIASWDNVTQGPTPPDLNPSGDMFALYTIGVGFEELQFLGAPGPEPQTTFFGVWCNEGIGRINIYDDSGPALNAMVNIEMWL